MTASPRIVALLSRVTAVLAVTAGLVLLGAMSPGGATGYALLASAVLAALVVVLTSSGCAPRTHRFVPARAGGASGHVEASTAYWCTVPVPHLPQRPRAPGRG